MARSVTVIPAKSRQAVRNSHKTESKKIRVAAYCRVSTDQEDQLHSFDAQVNYYTKYITDHENYEMAGIYADEGISGTNTKKREQFKRMIADCDAGKIDQVITKSISRFARNTQDCLEYSRRLKALGIGIFFEKENINTLDSTGELLFTILSSLAQDESRNISENCKWGIRTKFKKGEMHLNTYKFLGYDKDGNGKLVVNKEQAKTVRRIYREFLWGMSPAQIAQGLEDDNVPGCLRQTRWYKSTVLGILQNEKYMGDALLQKTYTADFLTKKQVKNNGEVTQVYIKDSHPAIVDKKQWNAVQEEIARQKKYVEEHMIGNYNYGTHPYPFSLRTFCGKCGQAYSRHSWASRGIIQWQCKGHRVNGKLSCTSPYIDNNELEQAFIRAYNRLIAEDSGAGERWAVMKETGTPLEQIRAEQMMELAGQGSMERFVPEIAQLVLQEAVVTGIGKFEFRFMDNSIIKI